MRRCNIGRLISVVSEQQATSKPTDDLMKESMIIGIDAVVDKDIRRLARKAPKPCANNAPPRRLPGQCATMHPKPTTLGVNAPYRAPRMSGHY